MAIEQAWLLKGWLLSQSPPKEVSEAIEAVIEALAVAKVEVRQEIAATTSIHDMLTKHGVPITPVLHADEPAAPKKARKTWSEERKAAQAERMRATQARLKQEKHAPGEAQAPAEVGA